MADKTYTIDATGKKLGRIATEAATILMNKHTPAFRKNIEGDTNVVVENASKIVIDEKKLVQKKYGSYSGYPGGLSFKRLEEVIEQKGHGDALRRAVKGMLPKNRLQAPRLKRLSITE